MQLWQHLDLEPNGGEEDFTCRPCTSLTGRALRQSAGGVALPTTAGTIPRRHATGFLFGGVQRCAAKQHSLLWILIEAYRLDAHGQFLSRIEAPGSMPVATRDAAAAEELIRLGIDDPLRLLEHARRWGIVEIVAPL